MDTEKCKALLVTIETGSLSAAAEQLGYTPSGISRMMAALEQEVGFPLLARSRAGVTPTQACVRLMPVIKELAQWGERLTQLSAEICGLKTGEISVGTAYGIYYGWLSKLIAAFTSQYPGIKVCILEGTSSELSKALDELRADFCIISQREGLHDWIPVREDEIMAWLPPEHPMASGIVFPLEAYAVEPFIDIYPGQETDNSGVFKRNGILPNTRFTTIDINAAHALVEAGLGVSMVNGLIATHWEGRVVKLPLDPPQTVEIGIAVPQKAAMSPAAKYFLEFALERITEL